MNREHHPRCTLDELRWRLKALACVKTYHLAVISGNAGSHQLRIRWETASAPPDYVGTLL